MVENNFRIVPSTTQDTDLNRMSERSLGGDSLVRTPSVMSEADVSFYRGPVKTVPHPDSLHGGSLTMRRSGSFYMEESTIEESALGIRLRRVSLHRQIHSEAIVDQGWDAEDRKTQSLEAPHDHLDLDPISSHAPGTRREHLLECLEIFPSGDSRAQSIPRSYILGIAKESEGSNVSRSSKGIKKRVMRQQLGNCLQFRDFRQVDPAFLGKPAISVRRNAIVVSLLEIRAILLFNRCFLFNMDGLSKLQTDMVLTRIKDGRESADVSETGQAYDFEFCALEGLLQALTTRLEKDFNQMNDEILRWVDTLANILFTPVLEGFRASKGDLNRMLTEIEENQVVLDTLLDDDEEMASMYLTELHRNPGSMRKTIDHEEMEMLLENYVQVVDDISIRGKVLMETLHDAESLVELRLDSLQNRLLLVNLIIQSVALVVASGSMVGRPAEQAFLAQYSVNGIATADSVTNSRANDYASVPWMLGNGNIWDEHAAPTGVVRTSQQQVLFLRRLRDHLIRDDLGACWRLSVDSQVRDLHNGLSSFHTSASTRETHRRRDRGWAARSGRSNQASRHVR
uniref:Magnesium transporter n=1 Tax=Rhodosorus marinus TaxID=101924 RepID=A0A7S3EGZ8_9RHOD|mmetsp:Transcript_33110/g.130188  ORF Transcript_33110/g.130188 Transcript_33110/m.130188 type:complete len:569 (+) Transcript_33110:604-2310(+)